MAPLSISPGPSTTPMAPTLLNPEGDSFHPQAPSHSAGHPHLESFESFLQSSGYNELTISHLAASMCKSSLKACTLCLYVCSIQKILNLLLPSAPDISYYPVVSAYLQGSANLETSVPPNWVLGDVAPVLHHVTSLSQASDLLSLS
ncbi:hypothetical protein HMI56_003850 [Coelomomyces lativittatus]|nr:hypothetical protein HMI56_003850 [Coelomomyces lativittatus]